jgi:hypothetical protein
MISIRFVTGTEDDFRLPKGLASKGLNHRFAVIQDTHLSGHTDMYFDATLWETLVQFLTQHAPHTTASVAENFNDIGKKEIVLSDYLVDLASIPDSDKEPPAAVVLRKERVLHLCMVTEYWTRVGGRKPYADSYTYSLLSDHDVSAAVIACLQAAPHASQWHLSPEVLTA